MGPAALCHRLNAYMPMACIGKDMQVTKGGTEKSIQATQDTKGCRTCQRCLVLPSFPEAYVIKEGSICRDPIPCSKFTEMCVGDVYELMLEELVIWEWLPGRKQIMIMCHSCPQNKKGALTASTNICQFPCSCQRLWVQWLARRLPPSL